MSGKVTNGMILTITRRRLSLLPPRRPRNCLLWRAIARLTPPTTAPRQRHVLWNPDWMRKEIMSTRYAHVVGGFQLSIVAVRELHCFLSPPGNVEGLAKDIRNASDFLSVHCERAAFTGSPPKYIPVDTIKKQTPEDIARTIIVCSKSCFLTRYFKSGNLFRGRKSALLTAYDISRTNTSSLNARSLIPIARIVVDEAHLIRNASSAFLHCLQMAPCPVWFMTG